MKIAITSQSKFKNNLIDDLLNECKLLVDFLDIELFSFSVKGTPNQPLNSTLECCRKRIEILQETEKFDCYLSIENGIEMGSSYDSDIRDNVDVCYVVLKTPEKEYVAKSEEIPIPEDYLERAVRATPNDYEYRSTGLMKTIGELINEDYPEVPANNWMSNKRFSGVSREEQMSKPLEKILYELQLDTLKKNITYHNDFPKPGVVFQDLSYILNDYRLLQMMVECMVEKVKTHFKDDIDHVVGLDSRGFIYGSLLAPQIGSGFVMVRKAGKLPGKTISTGYTTEYSSDKFEIINNVIKPEENVLIVDDLVATGGSFGAAKELVEKVGGRVVGYFTILKVDSLFEVASTKLNNLITLFD